MLSPPPRADPAAPAQGVLTVAKAQARQQNPWEQPAKGEVSKNANQEPLVKQRDAAAVVRVCTTNIRQGVRLSFRPAHVAQHGYNDRKQAKLGGRGFSTCRRESWTSSSTAGGSHADTRETYTTKWGHSMPECVFSGVCRRVLELT